MAVLGVFLLILAALLTLWAIFAGGTSGPSIDKSILGIDLNVSPLTMFVAGAIALALVWAATRAFVAGGKRGLRRRRERKELVRERDSALSDREAARERDQVAPADSRGYDNRGYDDRAATDSRAGYADDHRAGYPDDTRAGYGDAAHRDGRGDLPRDDRLR
ncbi:hypothetical protein G9U51_05805 [Calidifontibacter sp. DB0510]|uniref:LapA family protein n=1 Tax=Metallococcus carri TaxID=1656884 RepID=A0A967AZ15_9MICO|nr:hypothetical protein [Metallococcus carri]NHN55298.1 hypothetical protein [Metallococcus carri]NOP36375.1 hypothetical protein [Calidifontibacter sp. DB2511S]